MKRITKKLLTAVVSAALAISTLPVVGFADAISETIPVGDNSAWIVDTLDYPVPGIQFGRSAANMVRTDSYIYFELKDIPQIEKLELNLTSNNGTTYKITKYKIADMLPAETDIALYGKDTDEYNKWMAFDREMTDLANDEQIQITTTAANSPASADVTSLINGCQKENGFFVLKIFNRQNRELKFSSSNLKVTYKDGYTAPDYLDDINSAMSAADMKAAMTNAAADYFGVDNDALYDMSGVYESLVTMIDEEDFTKESFKEAFDTEVEKYVETKEITIDNAAYFDVDSTTTGLTNLNFKGGETLPTAQNKMVPFIGAKLNNTAAIKEIELYTYATSDNSSRQFAVRGAYLLDEFKTGNESVYQAPAEDETNEIYSFWKEMGDDFINNSKNYNSGYFNIGREGNKVMTACSNDSIKNIKTVDLTDYVKNSLNKHGEGKYLTLHINATDNMNIQFAFAGDDTRVPKFIVKYDTTVSKSAKASAWNALEEAMSADDIKVIVESYGTALGIDKVTKLTGNTGVYEALLSSIEDYDNIEEFVLKAKEIYNKYTTVKTVMPSEEIMYNNNGVYLCPDDGTFATGKRYITQYSREALGNGENILSAEYQLYTAEKNVYANNSFVRTIPAIEFEGFNQNDTYYLSSTNAEYNEVAAAAVSNDVLGTQWNYRDNAKPVSRIKLVAGANTHAVDVTDSLKEKLNMNLNKVAYVVGVEEQNGIAQLDNSMGSAAVLSVTYDRTYNAQAAMAAFNAAQTADEYKKALTDYEIEFNVAPELVASFDVYTDEAIVEGLAALKESCETIFDIEEALKTVNFKTSMTKFEIQSFTDGEGSLKANVKKLSAYNGEVKPLFVSYKAGKMIEVLEAENAEELITAEKGDIIELTAKGSLGDYDTVKVIIINSYAQLTPLAVVYSPAEQ